MKYSDIQNKLKGRKIIITAGGTIEPLDPVRYIGNFSSGKMGIALASAFSPYTKNLILIYGHITKKIPPKIKSIQATTVLDMYYKIKKEMTPRTILIMAAAVSDYKVKKLSSQKIKKSKCLSLKLIPTLDILKELSKHKAENNFFIGFAAETHHLISHAKKKLRNKKLDLLIANPVTQKHYPFGADKNKIYLVTRNKIEEWPLMTKEAIAKKLVPSILNLI